jgi:hypothetical protein
VSIWTKITKLISILLWAGIFEVTILMVHPYPRIVKSIRGVQWLNVQGSIGSNPSNIPITVSCLSNENALALRPRLGNVQTDKHFSVTLDFGSAEQSKENREISIHLIDGEGSKSDGAVIKVKRGDEIHKRGKYRGFKESSLISMPLPPLLALVPLPYEIDSSNTDSHFDAWGSDSSDEAFCVAYSEFSARVRHGGTSGCGMRIPYGPSITINNNEVTKLLIQAMHLCNGIALALVEMRKFDGIGRG